MLRARLGLVLVGFAVVLFAASGCGQSPKKDAATGHEDHDHEHGHEHGHEHAHEGHEHAEGGDHPKTYAEAVTKIAALHDTVRDSLSAKENSKADEAVHELGHLLEDVPGLAGAASLSADDLADVKKAAEELLDLYGKIDEQLHGGKDIAYDELSAKIDAAVDRLKSRAGAEAPAAEPAAK